MAESPSPISNLMTPASVGEGRQHAKLALLDTAESGSRAAHPDLSELDARIRSYELAFRMQAKAPEAVDLTHETEATRELYGMDQKADGDDGADVSAGAADGGAGGAVRAALQRGGVEMGCAYEDREEPYGTVRPDGSAGGGIDQGFEDRAGCWMRRW